MRSISLSSRVTSVADEKSGDAVSMRRMMEVGVRLGRDDCEEEGGSRPISEAYSTRIVAS
jgi:hypothetical protein